MAQELLYDLLHYPPPEYHPLPFWVQRSDNSPNNSLFQRPKNKRKYYYTFVVNLTRSPQQVPRFYLF